GRQHGHGALHRRDGGAHQEQDHQQRQHGHTDDQQDLQCSHWEGVCMQVAHPSRIRHQRWRNSMRRGVAWCFLCPTSHPHPPMRSFLTLVPMAALALCVATTVPACKSKAPAGSVKVKQPFTGNKYESNNAWFRGTGQGTSVKQNIARGKADLDAKNQIAAQVGTNMRAVTDQYLAQTDNANAADVADKFQSLV